MNMSLDMCLPLRTSVLLNSISIALLQSYFCNEKQRWLPDRVLFLLYCIVCVCRCVYMYKQRSEVKMFCLLQQLSTLFQRQFLTEPGYLNLTRLAGHEGPGILLPVPPQHWDYRCVPLHSAFFVDVEYPTHALAHVYVASILPTEMPLQPQVFDLY